MLSINIVFPALLGTSRLSPIQTHALPSCPACLVLTPTPTPALPCPALPYRRVDRAAKLTTSVRFGGVGDIQANLVRAEKSQLVGRDVEGASLLMHAAQRGETEVFRVVLEFLAEKLSPQEVSEVFAVPIILFWDLKVVWAKEKVDTGLGIDKFLYCKKDSSHRHMHIVDILCTDVAKRGMATRPSIVRLGGRRWKGKEREGRADMTKRPSQVATKSYVVCVHTCFFYIELPVRLSSSVPPAP